MADDFTTHARARSQLAEGEVHVAAAHVAVPPWSVRLSTLAAVRSIAIGLTLLGLVRFYWFIASAGNSGSWPMYMNYYDLLAEAFRAGQLHVPVAPHPELLAQTDPYSPLHVRLWMWDVTLYGGRYYMYWGPVPALLQAAVKSAFDIDYIIGDQYLVFAMFCLCAFSGALLIERLQRRLFVRVPLWTVLLAIVAYGCANPAPFLVATAGVYQASIAATQAFLLLGLLFAFDAVWGAREGKPQGWRLLLAGHCWALALGSRVSVGAAIGLLIVLTAAATSLRHGSAKRSFCAAAKAVFFMASPVAVAMALLLFYNKRRFDDWFEFGTDLMLTTMKFRVSAEYVLVNLYSYLLRPFQDGCSFPFVRSSWLPGASAAFPDWLEIPAGYIVSEPLVGIVCVVITTWFIPLALIAAYRALRRLSVLPSSAASSAGAPRDVSCLFCVGSFALLSTVTGMITLGMYFATMRYLADVTNGLVLLGTMGTFVWIDAARPGGRRALALVTTSAALLATLTVGALLGFQGYNGHFQRFNPTLHEHLQQTYSLCE